MPLSYDIDRAEDRAEAVELTWSEIEQRAEAVARDCGFDYKTQSVRDFAEELGGNIQVLPPDEVDRLESGSLVVRGKGDFDILLSPSTSILRDNFTIAHELGHYFLHSGNPIGSKKISVNRHGTNRCEQQANRFAAALLMPAGEFRSVAEAINRDALAGWFGVSMQAIKARLSSLRIQ